MTAVPQSIVGVNPDTLHRQPPLTPCSDEVLTFLHDLSASLLNDPDCRPRPNLVGLGFWLRPASLRRMVDDFGAHAPGYRRYAAGLVFHLAPANVDNLFVYSWAISLLCGNSNIIRLSRREGEERRLLLDRIKHLLKEPRHREVAERTAIVAYDHDDACTTTLSAMAARRVLWGSDETITHLRSLPAPPLCQDIVFPDRRSVAVLSAAAVLQAASLETLLEAFYRDSYGFDQMACSSPRQVIWLRDAEVATARDRFWKAFAEQVARKNPSLSPATLMDKQVAIQSMAITDTVAIRPMADARLQVIELTRPQRALETLHPGGGLFLDTATENLDTLQHWLPGDHQTMTYWGVDRDKLQRLAAQSTMPLADRIVPVGQALDFSPVWDGMNLLERLSRLVRVA